jgi:hypothetical protein
MCSMTRFDQNTSSTDSDSAKPTAYGNPNGPSQKILLQVNLDFDDDDENNTEVEGAVCLECCS